jgi:two-component system, cell cycle sensor histidine kinase and response regulator CckA
MNSGQAPQTEIQRLRGRIAELEEEIERLRAGDSAELFRDSDLRYKEVFDHISVCMFLVDVTSDGRFRFAGFNPAEEKAIGLSTAQVSGKLIEEVFDAELARKLTSNYRRCLEAGATITFEDELKLPAGSRYFHSNLIPIRDSSGEIHRIVGACIDTTDFKRTQEQALATQKLESLGVVASGIAHDFNNLLGSIEAESQLLMEELPESSTAWDSVSRIDALAGRASEIVRQLMVYAGQESADFEEVDLVSLVREMMQLIRVSISKTATLEVDLPDRLPPTRANAAQIRQVILNLITNASEAIGGNAGVICVKLGEIYRDEEPLGDQGSHLESGNYLRLEVADTGCGMNAEIQAAMFDPFFTTKGVGRGLGLSAVQGIIRSHSAKMSVLSVPGGGSRIEILLPCLTQSEKTPIRDAAPHWNGEDSVRNTVLVIEDEEALRFAVAKMLRRRGISVFDSGDGRTGVDLFRAHAEEIDVVLLDVTLPGLSGREVLDELKKIQPTVKVILTSAYGRERALGAFDQEPAQSYIRKPYRLAELTDLIQRTCSAGRPAMSNAGSAPSSEN